MFKLSQQEGRPSENFRLNYKIQSRPVQRIHQLGNNTHLFQKLLLERTANDSCRTEIARTEKNYGFHIWCVKTMSSSRGVKLILPHERLTGTGLT